VTEEDKQQAYAKSIFNAMSLARWWKALFCSCLHVFC
jgi:hypothetical protein